MMMRSIQVRRRQICHVLARRNISPTPDDSRVASTIAWHLEAVRSRRQKQFKSTTTLTSTLNPLNQTTSKMDTLVAQYSRPMFEKENYDQDDQMELYQGTPSLSLRFAMPPIAQVSFDMLSTAISEASAALKGVISSLLT